MMKNFHRMMDSYEIFVIFTSSTIKNYKNLSVMCLVTKQEKPVFFDETGLVVSNRIILHKPTNETRYIWK